MEKRFVTPKEASKILGVTNTTLHKYDKDGIIETIRTPGGKRMYNIQGYVGNENKGVMKRNICYCRVSTHGQKDDLKRQIQYMKDKYPTYEIISDVGSGINYKRKGFKKILKYGIDGELGKLAIAYKDRLCRIGYEMVEFILEEYSNTEIIIENNKEESPEEEVVSDLLQIITVFSARVNGLRSYKKQIQDSNILKK